MITEINNEADQEEEKIIFCYNKRLLLRTSGKIKWKRI